MASLLPKKLKPKVTFLYPTHKVSVKVSRSVVGMAYRPTLKVVISSETYYSPTRTNHSCDDEYIGETSRTFDERYKEHLKDPSPIHQHSNHTGYPTSHNNFQIIGWKGHSLARNIKESIFISVNNPTLHRNIGKFNLPHIWDRVLHVHAVGHVNYNNSNTPV